VLASADVKSIVAGLEEIRAAVRANPAVFDAAPDEDIHSFVERSLIEKIGDAGKRLHTGPLEKRTGLGRFPPVPAGGGFRKSSARLPRSSPRSPIRPRRPVRRRCRRTRTCDGRSLCSSRTRGCRTRRPFAATSIGSRPARVEADLMPLGSGAIAGTAYDIDVNFLADRLGFSRVTANSIDTSGDRDFVATFLYACSMVMVHLSRLAEDAILFSSEEFGFVEIDDSVSTGSSLMPQKKNPDPLELVRGKSGKAIGLLTGWLTTMKGLPLGYNKDLQEDKAIAFEAEDMVIACALTTATVVRTLRLRPDVARAAASGLLLATEVADYLVGRGVPFRTAHEVTGRIVRILYTAGKDFSSLSLDDWRGFHELFDAGSPEGRDA
jgi:argininosuccinate lyase